MSSGEYRVLARKYRPTKFSELIGHDTLVRTLTNAFASGRIAHAFMLTGVRGVGKTTTARLIARALNCEKGPSIMPCGECDACRAIAEDRHPDVIEMDAASRTGVDDVRELIEQVRYKPVSARYKIYIIDEVHMLSRGAFNALLKTLEEPPPDIKFIFATTEINKVPVTVLSRCQRYNLPRIPTDTLASYYGVIAGKESVAVEPEALALVARAADGSVRDGLSILDQAIALSLGAAITEASVRDMLGVADRGLVFDLFETVMRGDAASALQQLEALYNGGTDPVMVLQDLLDVTHFLTRLKLEKPGDPTTATAAQDGLDRRRGMELAQRLGMAALSRSWQMLLKGLSEVQTAPQPLKAAEMALVRLVYVADLPPPAEIVRALQNGAAASAANRPPAPSGNGSGARAAMPAPRAVAVSGGAMPAATPAQEAPQVAPRSFADMLELVAAEREQVLYNLLATHVHLVRYEPGLIEFRPAADAPRDLASKFSQFLLRVTGSRWMISISGAEGEPTLRQSEAAKRDRDREAAEAHPLVRAVLATFPGARIERITGLQPPTPAEPEPAPALYEEDDPGPFAAEYGWDGDSELGDDP